MTDRTWRDRMSAHRTKFVVTAGLLAVAVVGALILVPFLGPDPKDVVEDYLDAIRGGDTEAALAIAGGVPTGADSTFLSPAALADDWTVDSVVERDRFDDTAYVDVTISAGELSEPGRFRVVREQGEDWRIEHPFVEVNLDEGSLDLVELGSVRRDADSGPLLLFPGVYELYPSVAKQLTFTPARLIAAPRPEGGVATVTRRPTLTDATVRAGQRAINTYVDDCAKKSVVSPAGCPINTIEAFDGFDDPTDITWQVVGYPEARFVVGADGLTAVVRKRGTMTVTATATPFEPAGSPPTTVTGTCEFGLDNMGFELTMKGIVVSAAPDGDQSTSTECY